MLLLLRLSRLIALVAPLLAQAGSAAFAFALMQSAAIAETRALLVGVSDYLYLDADLRGPRNDVVLMREALQARGVAADAIQVLSEDAEVPTKAAILAALDRLAEVSGPGDEVLFYFSGHGAQAPDISGDEQGGYDEIFLPADAKGWSSDVQAVENGILDDEFRTRAAAILAKGAQLAVILDACHSATGFRAIGGAGVARTLAPRTLGIPEAVGAETGTPATPLQGDFVFLYAAQSDERAFEYPQGPIDDPSVWFGDFTRALARNLREVPSLTWSQLLQAALDEMEQGGSTVQTPDAEGPLLDAAVFGSAAAVAPRTRFDGSKLQAGRLDGLSEGAVFALYPDAAGDEEPVALAQITEVTARSATLAAIEGTAPAAGYAALRTPGPPPPVRFSTPQRRDASDGQDYGDLTHILAGIAGQDLIDGAEFGAARFDIGLVLTDGAVALTGADGVLDPDGSGTSLRVADPADLTDALDRAARVHRLRAALASARGRPSFLSNRSGLKIEFGHRAGDCEAEPGAETRPIRKGLAITPCDEVRVYIENTSLTARDVTVLYIDAANIVTPLYPTGGRSNRIAFGETAMTGARITEGEAARGREEIVVIAVPAEESSPRTDLSGLADASPTRAAGVTGPTANWLFAATNPDRQTRNFSFAAAVDPVQVTRMHFLYQTTKVEN